MVPIRKGLVVVFHCPKCHEHTAYLQRGNETEDVYIICDSCGYKKTVHQYATDILSSNIKGENTIVSPLINHGLLHVRISQENLTEYFLKKNIEEILKTLDHFIDKIYIIVDSIPPSTYCPLCDGILFYTNPLGTPNIICDTCGRYQVHILTFTKKLILTNNFILYDHEPDNRNPFIVKIVKPDCKDVPSMGYFTIDLAEIALSQNTKRQNIITAHLIEKKFSPYFETLLKALYSLPPDIVIKNI